MGKFIDPINQIDRELHCSHNQLSSKIRNHESNLDIHVTKDDKDLWNSKADKSYVDAEQSKAKSYTDEQISAVNKNVANTLQDYTTKEYSDSIYSNKDSVNSSLSDINKQILSKADKTYVDSVKHHVDQIDSDITTNHYTKQQVDDKLDDVQGKDYSVTRFDLQGNKLTLDQTNGKQRQVILPIQPESSQVVTKDQLNAQLTQYVKTNSIKTLTVQQGADQTIYNPILSDKIIQISGGDGSANNRYVPYFQNTTSNTEAPLVPDNGKFPHDCTDPVQRKWSTSSTIRQSGEFTWVTYAYINSSNSPQLWVSPICITGENGEDGVDTTKREFIYRTSTTADPGFYVPDTSLNSDGYIPSGWSGSPNGVDEVNQYEWMCYRDKANDVWSKWKPLGDNQKPLIWSHFGVNGVDADGIEYIYYAGKEAPSDNPSSWYTNQQSSDGDVDANGIQYNSNNYIPKDSKWKQDPVDLTGQQYGQGFYQFVSIRKKISDDDSGKKYWHQYSNPTLWSYYAVDGGQGLKGSPLRYAGEHKENTVYYDGTVSINGIYYQDYVMYKNVYYICTSWQKGTDDQWSKTPDYAEYFKPVSMTDAQFINQLISNKAYIEELSSKEVVITDDTEIVAGMTSGKKIGETSNLNGKVNNKGDVRIWAGEFTDGDLTTAPFTVTSTGKLNATDADITGTINSKSGNIGGFAISDKSLVSESGSIIKFFNKQTTGTTLKFDINVGNELYGYGDTETLCPVLYIEDIKNGNDIYQPTGIAINSRKSNNDQTIAILVQSGYILGLREPVTDANNSFGPLAVGGPYDYGGTFIVKADDVNVRLNDECLKGTQHTYIMQGPRVISFSSNKTNIYRSNSTGPSNKATFSGNSLWIRGLFDGTNWYLCD